MSHKIDPQQRHIGYEHCNICEGIYLDAGEFTDLKYLTILDRCRNAASTKKIKDGWNLFRCASLQFALGLMKRDLNAAEAFLGEEKLDIAKYKASTGLHATEQH